MSRAHFRHRHVDEAKDEVVAQYLAGETTHTLGKAYGVNQTTIWKRLIDWGVELRSPGGGRRKLGGALFNYGAGGNYLATISRKKRTCYVHRGCWEAYHGAIPKGHVIHHIDRNPLNNEVGNLACMTISEHVSLHRAKQREANDAD